MYIPLEEDYSNIFEENCVVFKGLRTHDPMGEVSHIAHVLFKVLRINFEVKRVVLTEENAGGVLMVIEFTESVMAEHMLQKAQMVVPTIKTAKYNCLAPLA